jgi:hypothetical protein
VASDGSLSAPRSANRLTSLLSTGKEEDKEGPLLEPRAFSQSLAQAGRNLLLIRELATVSQVLNLIRKKLSRVLSLRDSCLYYFELIKYIIFC